MPRPLLMLTYLSSRCIIFLITMKNNRYAFMQIFKLFNQKIFFASYPSAPGHFLPHGYMQELFRKFWKNDLNIRLEHNFTTSSYGVGIDVFDVHKKLVNYAILSFSKFLKYYFSFTKAAQIAINQFLELKDLQGLSRRTMKINHQL